MRTRLSKQTRNSRDPDIGWFTTINNTIKCEKLILEESSGVLYRNNAELSERINRLTAEYDQYAPSFNQYDDNNIFEVPYCVGQSPIQSLHKTYVTSPTKYSDISNRLVAPHNHQHYNHQEHLYSVPHKSRSYRNDYANIDGKNNDYQSAKNSNEFHNSNNNESEDYPLTRYGHNQYSKHSNGMEQHQINRKQNNIIENGSAAKFGSPLYTDIFDNTFQAENHLNQFGRPDTQYKNDLEERPRLRHNNYNNHDESHIPLNNGKSNNFESSNMNNEISQNHSQQDTVSLRALDEILSRKLEPLKSGLTSTDKTNDEYPYSQMSYEKIQFLDNQQKAMKDILNEHSHLLHEINSKDKPTLQIFKEITNKLDEQEKYAKDKNQSKNSKEDNGEFKSLNLYLNSKLGDHDQKLIKIDDQLNLILSNLQNKKKENEDREVAELESNENIDNVDNFEKNLNINQSKRSLPKFSNNSLDVNIGEIFIIPTKSNKTESTKPTSGFGSNTEVTGLSSSMNEYDNNVEEQMETKLVKVTEQSPYNDADKGSLTNNQLMNLDNSTTTSNTDSLLSLTASDNGPPGSSNSVSLNPFDKNNMSNDSNHKRPTPTNSNETAQCISQQNLSGSNVKHFSASTPTVHAKSKSKLPVKEILNKNMSKDFNNNPRNASISTQANQPCQSLTFSKNQDDIRVNKTQTMSKIPKRSKSAERIIRDDKQISLNNSNSFLNDLESSYETLYDPVTTPRNHQDENICF